MTQGQGTGLTTGSNHDLQIQRSGLTLTTGIVQLFSIAQTAAALAPTVTEGWVMTWAGMLYIKSAAVPSAVASVNTLIFFNPGAGSTTGTFYTKTTYAPTNPDDLYLGGMVASATAITSYVPGKWMNASVVQTGFKQDLTATAGTYGGRCIYNGPPCFSYMQEAKITTTTTGATANYTWEKCAILTDTKTAIATGVVIGAVTALTTTNTIAGSVQNVLTTGFTQINPGDYVLGKVGTVPAGAGNADTYAYLGGSTVLV